MANIWSLRFFASFIIFAQVFLSTTTNLKVLSLSDMGKGQCIGKYRRFNRTTDPAFLFMKISSNDFDKIPFESTMENNGHVLKFELNYNGTAPTIEVDMQDSVGVAGTFRFKFLYFQCFERVSKILLYKNISLPAELHFVFYDVNAKSYEHAVGLRKGVIVLSFDILVHPFEDDFDFLTDDLKYVRQPHSKTSIENVDLDNWAKGFSPYFFAYEGSFLEFPCQGTVVWIDFENVVKITPEAVDEFQKLKAIGAKPLMEEVSKMGGPLGMRYMNVLPADKAKKNFPEMPGLIIGVLLLIFCLF